MTACRAPVFDAVIEVSALSPRTTGKANAIHAKNRCIAGLSTVDPDTPGTRQIKREKQKRKRGPQTLGAPFSLYGGEGGIRTLDGR